MERSDIEESNEDVINIDDPEDLARRGFTRVNLDEDDD
jgi:hypothetical protein